MVRPTILVLGAIPAIIAMVLVAPMLLRSEIPFSAAVPEDDIKIEYTVNDLRRVSFGVTERLGAERTEILTLERNGDITLLITDGGYPQPTIQSSIDETDLMHIIALIKETGFMALPENNFPIKDDATEFTRHTVKITLNGAVTKITWPQQNATEKFIPPIITQVESKLEALLDVAYDK